jgi:hypothetical protein
VDVFAASICKQGTMTRDIVCGRVQIVQQANAELTVDTDDGHLEATSGGENQG